MKVSQSNPIKENYLSLFKTDGGQHLYRKIDEFYQSAINQALIAKTSEEKLQYLAQAEAHLKFRSYIDYATDNKLRPKSNS